MSSQIGKFQHFLLQGMLTIVAVLVVSSASLHAQNSQGTILGHVTDPSGAVLSGATVRVTNVATSVSRTAKTNAVGDYVFVNIPPGNYDVTVEAPGFSGSRASALRLDVEATLRQDFHMQVGAVRQEVMQTVSL